MNKETHPLSDIINLFYYYKNLTEKSFSQLDPSQIHTPIQSEISSIAVLMKHIAGNQISRWTNFRSEDGEKEWRNRDNEFVDDFENDAELLAYWEKGWATLFEALNSIQKHELQKLIKIRYEEFTISNAIEKHLTHVSYHTGQIVLIARFYTGDKWKSLSIPPGKTDEYNRMKYREHNPDS